MYIFIRLLQISVIVILLYSNTSSGETKFDFRKIRWGMTKEEVRKSETLKLLKEMELDAKEIVSYGFDKSIIYYDKTAEVQIHYVFLNDRLVSVLQLFADQYENKTIYIEAYEMYKAILTIKYGSTIDDEEIWLDDKYKGKYESALEAGDLMFHASWEDTRTRIDLCLSKNTDTNKILFIIIYGSKDLIHMENI